ncbi:MFS transporter [Pseudoalteromonas sp. B193]
MSIGPIMWVIFSEIFSSRVRSVALPFAALVQSISSWSIQQFFPWQLENMGAANTFLYYGGVAIVGCIVMAFILPETRASLLRPLNAIWSLSSINKEYNYVITIIKRSCYCHWRSRWNWKNSSTRIL